MEKKRIALQNQHVRASKHHEIAYKMGLEMIKAGVDKRYVIRTLRQIYRGIPQTVV